MAHLYDQSDGWRWGDFEHLLTSSKLMGVASAVINPVDMEADVFEWKLGRGACSVNTTYSLSREWDNSDT